MVCRPKLPTGEKKVPRFTAPAFYNTDDPEQLQRQLGQIFGGIQEALDGLLAQVDTPPLTAPVVSSGGVIMAKAGDVLRLSPGPAGLQVLLPTARSANKGQDVSIILQHSTGSVTVRAVQGVVQGVASVTLQDDGLRVFRSDGGDGTASGAGGWWIVGRNSQDAAGTTPVTTAQVVLGASSVQFPNGRVATDSAEVDAVTTTPLVISWALNLASVAFSKLANLTGISVLGRAANTTGVMAAITASGARQALMSDAAGTAIAWRAITTADLPAIPADTWSAVLAAGNASGANNPQIDVGQFANFGLAGPTTGAPQIRSGDATFRLRGSQTVVITGDTNCAVNATAGTLQLNSFAGSLQIAANGAGNFVSVSTGAVLTSRLVIADTGEWTTPTGGANDFPLCHKGAGTPPVFQRLPLTVLATQAAHTFLANATAGVASPTAITATVATAELDLFTSTTKGLVPLSGGGTTNFLRADGTFAAPPGGGSTPTGTGFRHVTAGVEDAASKLVDTADINNSQVTNAKLATMAANTFKANATAGVASPADVASNAQGVMGRTSGNIQSIDSAVQTALIRAAGSVFWASCASDQVLCRSGAGDLGFQALPLTALASQAADTFVGRLAGIGVPTAQTLSSLASTSIVYDAATHTLQRAALTGAVTAAQNVNATTNAVGWDDALAVDVNSGANSPIITAGQTLKFGAAGAVVSGTIQSNAALSITSDVGLTALSPSFFWTMSSGTENFRFRKVAAGAGGLQLGQNTTLSTAAESNTALFWVFGPDNSSQRAMFRSRNSALVDQDWPLDCTAITGLTASTLVSAATTALNLTGTYTAQANTLTVGSRFRWQGTYQFTRGATATVMNLSTIFNVGAGVIVVGATPTIAGTYDVRFICEMTVLTLGAAGTCMVSMYVGGPGIATGADQQARYGSNIALVINTTAALAMNCTAQMAAVVAATSIRSTGGEIERLR